MGVGRQAKRETALVSYNNLDATLTGCIIYTLTLTPSFEYDTLVQVSNTYSLWLRISRSHAHVVLCFSFHFSLWIFEQKRDCSQSMAGRLQAVSLLPENQQLAQCEMGCPPSF